MEDSTKVPLTPGSVINVPLGAKLEMQLKLPTESGSGIMVPAVCETDEGQTVMKKTTQSRTETQQSKRVATHGDQTVSESSQAVRKVMQDTRSMVHQSSTESNESQRIVKTTAQQQMKYTKQTFSSTSSFESSHN
ncbi:uncharacterized protein LOC119406133 [Rhipicephalus sanguineus]|uniref:uncharacterized protein LOC119406133 n=1 Tax=Rhipicephalus sanguineus TaxID=34632 RepID=UPI0018933A7A|nr:uncharacterized protein LOC119406133 [Rhipicephalus sanguineus]